MRVAIIDDEPNSRELLETMLVHHCQGVEVVGKAQDVSSGIRLIKEKSPEIVLLDIEMPGGDGWAVWEAFPDPEFRVVFVTGYAPVGMEAYALAALAWIQKPVELGLLQKLMVEQTGMPSTSAVQLELLQQAEVEQADALVLSDLEGHERIRFQDITYIEASRMYATFHMRDGKQKLAAHPLRHYEQILPSGLFFRVHKSFLVNGDSVKAIDGGRGGNLSLENGAELPIATRRKSDFLRFMKALG